MEAFCLSMSHLRGSRHQGRPVAMHTKNIAAAVELNDEEFVVLDDGWTLMFEVDTQLYCIHVFTSPHMRRTTGGRFALGRKTRFAYKRPALESYPTPQVLILRNKIQDICRTTE